MFLIRRNKAKQQFRPRPGQWVKVDGRRVGIAHRPSEETTEVHGPDCSMVHYTDDSGYTVEIEVIRNERLQPVVDRRDIPAARIAHLPADWQPRP